MPDWLFYSIIAVVCGVLLISIIIGFGKMNQDLRGASSRYLAYAILSLLLFPAMFTSCAGVNWLAKDQARDAFGFEYPDLKERTGFSTRSARRERLVENAFSYITSAHGFFSILIALIAGSPFMWCLWKVDKEFDFLEGYLHVAVPLGLIFLVIYAKS